MKYVAVTSVGFHPAGQVIDMPEDDNTTTLLAIGAIRTPNATEARQKAQPFGDPGFPVPGAIPTVPFQASYAELLRSED